MVIICYYFELILVLLDVLIVELGVFLTL